MKVLYIESTRPAKSTDTRLLEALPGKIHLLYSIQYKPLAQTIKTQLGTKIIAIEQVLGCSKIKPKTETLVLVSTGRFHAIQLAFSSGKEIYVFDGYKLEKITKAEIEIEKKKELGKLSLFYNSSSLGLLVSLKPGQNRLNQALKFKKKLEKKFKHKKFYIFIAETINLAELENFPITPWINFACPGLSLDANNILNYEFLEKIYFKRKNPLL